MVAVTIAIIMAANNVAAMQYAISDNKKPSETGTSTIKREIKTNGRPQAPQAAGKINDQIDKRIAELNKTIQRIQEIKNVSEAEKKALIARLQAAITSLTEIGDKAASTTENIKANRIYALIISQGYIIASVDRINNMALKMESLNDKLETAMRQIPANATDTDALDGKIDQMNSKIDSAQSNAAKAKLKLSTASTTTSGEAEIKANREIFVAAQKLIKSATQDLETARKIAKDIAKGLKDLGINTSLGFGNASSTKDRPAHPDRASATTTATTTGN